MLARALIERKRDGGRIAPDEWRQLMNAYAADGVPDYQMAALLMAICWRGMSGEETAQLTDCMRRSGQQLDLSALGCTVDKHSTGGVGDKTTLVLGPLAAACGMTMAKMSPADQKILAEVTQEAADKSSADIRKREAELEEEFKKKGINIIKVDRADFQARVLKAISFESMTLDKKDWDRVIAIK